MVSIEEFDSVFRDFLYANPLTHLVPQQDDLLKKLNMLSTAIAKLYEDEPSYVGILTEEWVDAYLAWESAYRHWMDVYFRVSTDLRLTLWYLYRQMKQNSIEARTAANNFKKECDELAEQLCLIKIEMQKKILK